LDKLDEGQKIAVSSSDYSEMIDLLTRVLVNGCTYLFKRGLDRNYIGDHYEYVGIKGKIDFKETLNKNLFKQGRSICRFDQFENNILQNQILKATLSRITKIDSLDHSLKGELWNCYWRFAGIDNIEVQSFQFHKVRIHRNNAFYDLLLKICKLIFENTVLDERSGKYQFKEFTGSDKQMANLFEAFIRNFYRKEQKQFRVDREDIQWDAIAIGESKASYLPKMQTDITLESKTRKIIIDTKYYANALVSRFESEKLHSSNLYQLYSYLRNIESKDDNNLNSNCEGVLLYPTVNYVLNEKYQLGNHLLQIKTIDLNAPWQNIKEELLSICIDN
jgi:5-methylcytosine-specific restriction enzyme subunit McrC